MKHLVACKLRHYLSAKTSRIFVCWLSLITSWPSSPLRSESFCYVINFLTVFLLLFVKFSLGLWAIEIIPDGENNRNKPKKNERMKGNQMQSIWTLKYLQCENILLNSLVSFVLDADAIAFCAKRYDSSQIWNFRGWFSKYWIDLLELCIVFFFLFSFAHLYSSFRMIDYINR